MSETIVMIHGMWGGPWYWANYKDMYEAAGHRCVTVTLPYHDMDPRDEPDPKLGTTSLLDYCDAIENELRQIDEQPIIMGHSMGGLLGQMLGARGLAKALVLLTPASPAGIMAITPSVFRSFWSIQSTWGFWRKPTRQTFNEAVYSMLNLMPEDEQQKTYDKFVYESGRATFEIGYWLIDARRATRIDASKVACPVLVLAGSQDRITPTSVVRKVAKKYQAVSAYKEFNNHAHWVIGEPEWEEVAEYALKWIASL